MFACNFPCVLHVCVCLQIPMSTFSRFPMARHHGHLGVASRLREEFAFTRTFQGTAIRLDSPIDLVFQRKKNLWMLHGLLLLHGSSLQGVFETCVESEKGKMTHTFLPLFFFLLRCDGLDRDKAYVIDRAQPRGRGMAWIRWYGACYDAMYMRCQCRSSPLCSTRLRALRCPSRQVWWRSGLGLGSVTVHCRR